MTETPTERRLREIVECKEMDDPADDRRIDKGRQAIALLRRAKENRSLSGPEAWEVTEALIAESDALLAACQEDMRDIREGIRKAGVRRMDWTHGVKAINQREHDALRAALALASRTCGNCGHARKQDDRTFTGELVLVCANESEAHPLPWCVEVADNFGCHNWVAKP